jgi:hypothetical protein
MCAARLPIAAGQRIVGGLLLAGGLSCALAHDLITIEAAERYLNQASAKLAVIKSHDTPVRRGEANVALGQMLDEIRDLLNRDIAMHGKVQGLPSNLLVNELKVRGTPLNFSAAQGRFLAHVDYYREALRLGLEDETACEAMFRWMRGYFYDSFEDDPLDPHNQTWEQLREQLAVGERFVKRCAGHAEMEEGKFILLVQYFQASRTAPDAATRATYVARTRDAAVEFRTRYALSMRTAAVPVLMEKLPK